MDHNFDWQQEHMGDNQTQNKHGKWSSSGVTGIISGNERTHVQPRHNTTMYDAISTPRRTASEVSCTGVQRSETRQGPGASLWRSSNPKYPTSTSESIEHLVFILFLREGKHIGNLLEIDAKDPAGRKVERCTFSLRKTKFGATRTEKWHPASFAAPVGVRGGTSSHSEQPDFQIISHRDEREKWKGVQKREILETRGSQPAAVYSGIRRRARLQRCGNEAKLGSCRGEAASGNGTNTDTVETHRFCIGVNDLGVQISQNIVGKGANAAAEGTVKERTIAQFSSRLFPVEVFKKIAHYNCIVLVAELKYHPRSLIPDPGIE
ncbi:hypothetical protein DFH06DRAFT_1127653 [Mycena polygramma]|nr:hypothetical protein DFH06DRAFT_1127653 [Mycena polygramma]